MVLETKQLTVEEFEQLAALPENADRRLELIGGRIVEVVSNSDSSEIGAFLIEMISGFVRRHKLGRVTASDGGYCVAGERYIPDVGFVRREKQPKGLSVSYKPFAPDLAVEVLSPSDQERDVRIKVVNYLNEGTVVWIVDPVPERKRVEVYVPGEIVKILHLNDTLEGGSLLPGFSLPVREIFEVLE